MKADEKAEDLTPTPLPQARVGTMTRRARTLRRSMTDAEARLWYLLRDRRLVGVKFRRQVPIGPYVVDFCCHERGLIVECDGSQHLDSATDLVRSGWLEDEGYRLMRFWNDDILLRDEAVMSAIVQALSEPSSAASGARRGRDAESRAEVGE